MKYQVLTMAAAVASAAAVDTNPSAATDPDAAKGYSYTSKPLEPLGCYSALNDDLMFGGYIVSANTAKACASKCQYKYDDEFVFAMHASECYCGMDAVPPDARRVDDGYCNLSCAESTTSSTSNNETFTCGGVRFLDLTGLKQQMFYTFVSSGLSTKNIYTAGTLMYDMAYNTSAADAPPPFPSSASVNSSASTSGPGPNAPHSNAGVVSTYSFSSSAVALVLSACMVVV